MHGKKKLIVDLVGAERDANRTVDITGKPTLESRRPRNATATSRDLRPRIEEVPERRAVDDRVVHSTTDEEAIRELCDLNRKQWHVWVEDVGNGDVVGNCVNEMSSGVVAVYEEGGGGVVIFDDAEAASERREEFQRSSEGEFQMINHRVWKNKLFLLEWCGFEEEKALLDVAKQQKLKVPWS
ncbi:hypothetical protein U1Q18_002394 [Sarracenia purpurea var. burkii]